MQIRTKSLNPNFNIVRGDGPFCIVCAKALRNTSYEVRYFRDRFEAIHTSHWAEMEQSSHRLGYMILAGEFVEVDHIGPDCAKRLGSEWYTLSR